jgi:hypothetical protein
MHRATAQLWLDRHPAEADAIIAAVVHDITASPEERVARPSAEPSQWESLPGMHCRGRFTPVPKNEWKEGAERLAERAARDAKRPFEVRPRPAAEHGAPAPDGSAHSAAPRPSKSAPS